MHITRVCSVVDLYQITMAYAYWKSDKCDDTAVFDLFFRRNPFQGELTIFAGLEECIKFVKNFHYSDTGNVVVDVKTTFIMCWYLTNAYI